MHRANQITSENGINLNLGFAFFGSRELVQVKRELIAF